MVDQDFCKNIDLVIKGTQEYLCKVSYINTSCYSMISGNWPSQINQLVSGCITAGQKALMVKVLSMKLI